MDEICALLATRRTGAGVLSCRFHGRPRFDPAQIRLAWTGGHIVACAKIYPRLLRVGTVVNADGRHLQRAHRPALLAKGLATSLLGECLSTVYLEGMTLSPLFAPRHTLFARRGWCGIPMVQLEIPAAALRVAPPKAPCSVTIRALEGRDLDAVMDLHEALTRGARGAPCVPATIGSAA